MNWYRIIKIAVPLPNVTNEYPNLPEHKMWAIEDLDRDITEKTKQELDKDERAYLDRGGYGIAYDYSEGVIEKITRDIRELDNALEIMKMQEKNNDEALPWIVKVFDAKQIQGGENNNEIPIYRLLLEKVIPLTEQERHIFEDNLFPMLRINDLELYLLKLKDSDNYIYRTYEEKMLVISFIKKMAPFVNHIKRNHVETWDLTPANVGFRGDQLVILDLGVL